MPATKKSFISIEVVMRRNRFEEQGAEFPNWKYIYQGYSPDPRYAGELLRDKYPLKEWVEVESPNGDRYVIGRGTATKYYGITLPTYRPNHPDTPNLPSR
jgi:hypothetical protein